MSKNANELIIGTAERTSEPSSEHQWANIFVNWTHANNNAWMNYSGENCLVYHGYIHQGWCHWSVIEEEIQMHANMDHVPGIPSLGQDLGLRASGSSKHGRGDLPLCQGYELIHWETRNYNGQEEVDIRKVEQPDERTTGG
ncbi:hypothetical protein ACJX0J_021888, partial [Zea mays]